MAALSGQQRGQAWNEAVERSPALARFDKPTGRAIAAAIDQWIEDNAAAFNAALPASFRGANSTTQEKNDVFHIVSTMRAGR